MQKYNCELYLVDDFLVSKQLISQAEIDDCYIEIGGSFEVEDNNSTMLFDFGSFIIIMLAMLLSLKSFIKVVKLNGSKLSKFTTLLAFVITGICFVISFYLISVKYLGV